MITIDDYINKTSAYSEFLTKPSMQQSIMPAVNIIDKVDSFEMTTKTKSKKRNKIILMGALLALIALAIAKRNDIISFVSKLFKKNPIPQDGADKALEAMPETIGEQLSNAAQKTSDTLSQAETIVSNNGGLSKEFVDALIKAQNEKAPNARALAPNGLLICGQDAAVSKDDIIDVILGKLKNAGISIKELSFDKENHSENASIIEKAFKEAKENFDKTGGYTAIRFKGDSVQMFKDSSLSGIFDQEMSSILTYFDETTKLGEGGVLFAAASDGKNIDPAVLKRFHGKKYNMESLLKSLK